MLGNKKKYYIFPPDCDYVDELLVYLYKMSINANTSGLKLVFILAVIFHALLAFGCLFFC